jgi:putative endonuclease
MFIVYMVRCADGTLYTGWSNDPHARVVAHNAGSGAKYTRTRLPVSLVYSERCESLSAALKRERQLKLWRRARKEALIAAGAPAWLDRCHTSCALQNRRGGALHLR